MVLVLWDFWKSHVSVEIQNLFHSNVATDVVLHVDHRFLEAHSFILVMFSKYLKDLISSIVKEEFFEPPLTLSFPDFTYESIQFVIDFMYSGKVTIPDEYLNEVIHLSKLLGIKGLEDLTSFISEDTFNVADLEIFEEDASKDIKTIIGKLKKHNIETELISSAKQEDKISKNDSAPSKRKRISTNIKKKRKLKFQKLFPQGPNVLDVHKIKETFLTIVEKYLKCTIDLPNLGNWPLNCFGIVLQKSRDDPYIAPPNVKCSKRNINRFRREMSYLWQRLMTKYTEEQRNILVRGIPNQIVQRFYDELLRGVTMVEFLESNTITPDELQTILIMLLISRDIEIELAIEAYSSIKFQPLYMDRIEKAIEQYSNSDVFLGEITKNLWIADFDLSNEIEKRGIQRNEKYRNFDKFLHTAIELSPNGFNKQNLLAVAPDADVFAEEIERIFEFHSNKIFLPMACYEMRMESAVYGIKFLGSSVMEAAGMYMVPSQHLEQRTTDTPMEDIRKFEYTTGKPSRTGRKASFSTCLEDAIKDIKEGGDINEVLVTYNIRNPKFRKIIEYNIKRPNPPLNEPYDSRFQKAIQMVKNDEMNIFEAACHCVVNYRILYDRLKKMKIFSPSVKKEDKSVSCGLWSCNENLLKEAIVSGNNGTPLPEVFEKLKINNEKLQTIVSYNVGREDAPLEEPFRVRLKKAAKMVQEGNAFLIDAACHNIVNFSSLSRYLKSLGFTPSKKEIPIKKKRLVGFWSKIDLKLRKGIEDARSGTPLEEVYQKHSIKCSKSRRIVKHNLVTERPPLNMPYRERFDKAISSIEAGKLDLISAACTFIVPYPVLHRVIHKKNKCIFPSNLNSSESRIQLIEGDESFANQKESVELEVTSTLIEKETEENTSVEHFQEEVEEEEYILKRDQQPGIFEGFKEGLKGIRLIDALVAVRKGETVEKACETYMVNTKEMRYVVNYNKDRMDPPLHQSFHERFQNAVNLVKNKRLPVVQAASRSIVSPCLLRQYMSKNHPYYDRLSIAIDDESPVDQQHWSNQEMKLRNAIVDANNGMDLQEVFNLYKLNIRNQRVVRYNVNRPGAPLDEPFEDRLQKALKMVEAGAKGSDAAKEYIINPGAIYEHFGKSKVKFSNENSSKRKFMERTTKETPASKQHKISLENNLLKAVIDANSGMELKEVYKSYGLSIRDQTVVVYNINRHDAPLGESFEKRLENALKLVGEGAKIINAAKQYIVSPSTLTKKLLESKIKIVPKKIKVTSKKRVVKNKKTAKARDNESVGNVIKTKKIMTLRARTPLKHTVEIDEDNSDLKDSDDDQEYNPLLDKF